MNTVRVFALSTRSCQSDRSERGQASILLIGGLAGVLIAVVIAGAVAKAVGREAAAQRAADLASARRYSEREHAEDTQRHRQRLQELFFPEGIACDGIRFNRTAVPAPL